ncbi:MAG: cell division protein FtsZ [Pseudomonadota bacterium]
MGIKLQLPKLTDLRPRLTVVGIGGAGCNAINNMIAAGLTGVDFVVANTDAQSLAASSAEHRLQLGVTITEGLGAGAKPEIGQAAAEEAIEDIRAQFSGSHMVFIAAGMGGGTGTGAASVFAKCAREMGILTVGVVTKPFLFEGTRRMRIAEAGIGELRKHVDTLIVIPNQNLFLIANEKTSFAEAFVLADQVLYSGVACIVDLIIKEGLINLDFADVRAVLANMGTAMMGTGEADGSQRAKLAAEEAITNPLLDDVTLNGAKGLLLSITGGPDLTLYEVDEAASRVREELRDDANIIVGATFDESLGDRVRVSIVASGMRRAGETDLPSVSDTGAEPLDQSMTWPGNPPPVQAPHVETYSYNADAPKPPSHLTPLMSGGGYAAEFNDTDQDLSAMEGPDGSMGKSQAPGMMHPSQSPHGDGMSGAESVEPRQAAGGPGRGQSVPAFQTWQAPGNVVIEEGVPPQYGHPASPSVTQSAEVVNADRVGDAGDDPTFVPATPAEAPRRSVRMPDVEDFPLVGQRAYRANKADEQAGSGISGAEASSLQSRRSAGRSPGRSDGRMGIFARLSAMTGIGADRALDEDDATDAGRVPDRQDGTAHGGDSNPDSGDHFGDGQKDGAVAPPLYSMDKRSGRGR